MTKITNRTVEKSYELYLSLYQAVTGTDEEQNIYKQFSPDFFDLVVVDECHRGSADEENAWHQILSYFSSATHIGMTATPKETHEVRGTLGNVAVYDETVPYPVVRINSGMLIVRADKSIITNDYLSIFIQSPIFFQQLNEKRSGSAQPQIPAKDLKTFTISTPSIEDQHRIVAKINELMALCDQLETNLRDKTVTAARYAEAIVQQIAAA